MVTLKEITADNFRECAQLDVEENQQGFVTSNAVSLAQSKYQPECVPFAVYSEGGMVGFVMYCVDADDGEYWIYRMMIDKRHQGKGYGKEALRLLVQRISKDASHHCIMLGVHRESERAVALYTGFGFKFTGQVYGAEHIMKYDY